MTWNKVTPFSKFLALVLFVALPFAGFFLGFSYGKVAGEGEAGSLVASSTLTGTAPANSASSTAANYYADPSEWQTDSNAAGGFSFAYPLDFSVQDTYKPAPSTGWRLNSNAAPGILYSTLTIPSAFEPGTNFADATLTVGASANDTAVAQCLAPDKGDGPDVSSSTATVNGIQFTVFRSAGVGAGNYYDTTSYRTLHAGQCYAVEYTVHSGQILNYPSSYNLQPFDESAVTSVLDRILGTFRFL